jgi:16S rRNA (guanine1207-N2)-methyltransferase
LHKEIVKVLKKALSLLSMPHYFSEKQDSNPEIKKIRIRQKDTVFELYSSSGIFSKDELDKGTELLIESAIIKEGFSVLDFGCGYGVVGVSIKKLYPETKILMTDINERAVMISNRNIKLHNLKGIEARKSDIFSDIKESFDTILLNPPQTAGRDICFRMIEESKDHLNFDGTLQIVARHNKGGETLSKKMEEVFGNVKDIAKKAGFRVYFSQKK